MMSLRTSYYILLDPSHCCNENITICMIRLVEKWIQLLNLAIWRDIWSSFNAEILDRSVLIISGLFFLNNITV